MKSSKILTPFTGLVFGSQLFMMSMDISYAEAKRKDTRGELEIEGLVKEVSVSPSGEIWLGSTTGKTYHSNRINGNWVYGPFELDKEPLSDRSIHKISFFDSQRAIATGYLRPTGEGVKRQVIYRTEDNWKTWTMVDIGVDQLISAAAVRKDGVGLIGGSNGTLVYSWDFGKTWTHHEGPFNENEWLRTIWISTKNRFLAGALRNRIRVSTNQGRSWKDIPTPLDQKLYAEKPDTFGGDKILNIAKIGEFLIVNQNHKVFYTRAENIKWKEFTDPPLVMFEVAENGKEMLALTDGGSLVRLDSRLSPLEPIREKIYAPIEDMTWANGKWFLLDANNCLYEWNGNELAFSSPLTNRHPIRLMQLVRKMGKILWGTTTNHIYQSGDLGKTWYRVGTTWFGIKGFYPKSRKEIILWDGHGQNALFSAKTGQLTDISDLQNFDVVDILHTPDGLVAYGGMSYESARRITVSRAFHAGEFAGSRDMGFVMLSEDRGKTWNPIDEWKKGGVAKLDVHPDGSFTLLSYLGSIRNVAKSDSGYEGKDILIATNENKEEVPHTQVPEVFTFLNDQTAMVSGWTHWVGHRAYISEDGAKSWTSLNVAKFPYEKIVRVGDKLIGLHYEGKRICRIEGRDCEDIFRLPDDGCKYPKITDISVEGLDNILVEISQNAKRNGWDRNVGQSWRNIKLRDSH